MKTVMSSKERLLAAINYQEDRLDHVPLCFRFLGEVGRRWNNQFDRAEELLALGVDPTIETEKYNYFSFHRDVKIKTWKEQEQNERYPLLFKEYITPKGKLTTIVKESEDWMWGDDIPLLNDWNVPRAKKFLITTEEDLEKLPFLFDTVSEQEIKSFYEDARIKREFAEKHELLFEGWQMWGGDVLHWLCGAENVIYLAMDKPQFVKRLMEFFLEKAKKTLEMLLDVGVDVIIRRGWYESTLFWSPSLYNQFIAPNLKQEAEIIHQAGAKFGYAISSGIMPLMPILREIGIDIIYYVDPVMDATIGGKAGLRKLKKEAGGKICLRGGVNSYLTVERGDRDEIDAAVTEAISVLAPGGGFILSAADAVGTHASSWDKVLIMIESWKKNQGIL